MSKEKNITDSLVTLMSFVKEQATASLVEQGRRIEISDNDLKKLSTIIEASISNSFMKGIDSIVKSANEK